MVGSSLADEVAKGRPPCTGRRPPMPKTAPTCRPRKVVLHLLTAMAAEVVGADSTGVGAVRRAHMGVVELTDLGLFKEPSPPRAACFAATVYRRPG